MSDGILRPCPKPKRAPRRVKVGGCSKRSKKSGGSLFPKLVSTGRRSFIRKQACVATGRKAGEVVTPMAWMPETLKALCPYRCRIEAAHIKSRGAGGEDAGNMIPLDATVHQWLHQIGEKAFVKRLRLAPLGEIAQHFEDRFLAKAAAMARHLENT